MLGMADPAKHADCEETRGTADDDQLPTGNARKICGLLSVNATKRHVSYFIVRNKMPGFVIFCHTPNVTIPVIFFVR